LAALRGVTREEGMSLGDNHTDLECSPSPAFPWYGKHVTVIENLGGINRQQRRKKRLGFGDRNSLAISWRPLL